MVKVKTEDLLAIETQRIYEETAIEREWWKEEDKFFTIEQARQAYKDGVLIVVPSIGDNYKLIGRLSGFESGEPNLLRPNCFEFLKYALILWHRGLQNKFSEIRLAITSLYRHEELQKALLLESGGCRAVGPSESSHLAGATFDISCRSYYHFANGQYIPIQSWSSGVFEFSKEPFVYLEIVLFRLTNQGLCNFVIENYIAEGQIEPSVFHVCINPEFTGVL